MLKKIGIGLVVAVLGFLGFIATRPSTYQVSRSITVAAPADVALAQVSDFHKWNAWSPWEKLDPAMKKTFDGSGNGATYAWVGNDKVGEGKMTITGLAPQKVDIKLEFIKPFEESSDTSFTTEPAGEGTKVTWTMKGNNSFVGKAFTVFMDMDAMIGKDFESGLAALKVAAEAAQKARAEAAAKKAAEEAAAAAEAAKAAEAAAATEGAVAAPATP